MIINLAQNLRKINGAQVVILKFMKNIPQFLLVKNSLRKKYIPNLFSLSKEWWQLPEVIPDKCSLG